MPSLTGPNARRPDAASTASAATAAELSRCVAAQLSAHAQVRADILAHHELPAQEQTLVAGAVNRRKQEFATGRHLARSALRAIGRPVPYLGMGKLREPLWPADVIGSISHDGEWCVAAVQLASADAAGLGVDLMDIAKTVGRMSELVPLYISYPHELDAVRPFCSGALTPELVAFSLKESILKAMSGYFDRFIDLREILLYPGKGLQVELDGKSVPIRVSTNVVGPLLVTSAVRSEGQPEVGFTR